MVFRFIHTGDWHIGKPFGRFDDDQAALLRQARLDAVDRIAGVAREQGAADVLVAGDVFDSPGLSDHMVRRLIERLRLADDVTWHLLPGNHDPARQDGIWARLVALGVPENIRLHLEQGVVPLGPEADLLVAPCLSHLRGDDPTAWMDEAATSPHALRIGLAHGPVHGFGGADDPGGMIAPGRRASGRLDYLALGDWHGTKEVAPGVWYAGTPEPEQFQENAPGHVLSVAVDGPGDAPRVTPVATARYRWFRRRFDLSGGAGEDDIRGSVVRGLQALDSDLGRCLVRIELAGEVSVDEEAEVQAEIEALAPAFFHIRVRAPDLSVHFETASDGPHVEADVAAVAARLQTMASGDDEQADVARRSLQLLARYERRLRSGADGRGSGRWS